VKRYQDVGIPHTAQRLYYLSTNFFIPGRQPPLPMPWTVALDVRSVQERKAKAFRQHVSQAPLMEQTREIFERYGAEEFYTLVAAAEPQVARVAKDLFEGLQG
jgi:LmbE family N-acetylglucosaminyl deacetylase